jgi:hypothetical protein
MVKSTDELWLGAALEEYKSLRAESLTAIQGLQSTLRFSLTGLAALFVLGFPVIDSAAGGVVFSILLPLFAVLLYLVWAIEFARMVRVGKYIEELERHVNRAIPGTPSALNWEQWLAGGAHRAAPRLPFCYAVPGIFLGASFGANLLRYIALCGDVLCAPLDWPLLLTSALGSSAAIYAISDRLRKLRGKYDVALLSRPDDEHEINRPPSPISNDVGSSAASQNGLTSG